VGAIAELPAVEGDRPAGAAELGVIDDLVGPTFENGPAGVGVALPGHESPAAGLGERTGASDRSLHVRNVEAVGVEHAAAGAHDDGPTGGAGVGIEVGQQLERSAVGE